MNRDEFLAIRLKYVLKEIERKNGADPKLVAVTKYSPVEDIEFIYRAGHRDFGENRVDELLEKSEWMAEKGHNDISWHFIGPLQSNKVNRLLKVPNLRYIHSIDSLKLLEGILKRADQFIQQRLGLFLQVNTSGESQKGGFLDYDSLASAVNSFESYRESPQPGRVFLAGLMTMGKIRTENFEEDAKHCFRFLNQFKKRLERDFDTPRLDLSMGMTRDFKYAIEEGSDWVRIGSALFSE